MTLKSLIRCALVTVTVGAAAWTAADELTPRRPGGRVDPTPTFTGALHSAGDCATLRSYITSVAVETVVRARYGWGWLWREGPFVGAGDGQGASAPSDYTGTNVQEQGVDELDIVKTDGSFLYVAQDDHFRILRSWPPEDSAEIASLELEGWASGLFLRGDHALVVSTVWDGLLGSRSWGSTRLLLYDVADRSAPALVRTVEVEGQLVGARMVDGQVYVVLWTWLPLPQAVWDLAWRDDLGLPVVDWSASEEEREEAAEIARGILRPLVQAVIADLPLEEMLPLFADRTPANPDPAATLLLECDEVYLPAETAQYSALSLVHLDLDVADGGPVDATGILADGWTVYASSKNLYVAQSSWWWWWGWNDLDKTTTIHKFELGGADQPVRYAASGEVPGWLLNQFSMGEYDGYLRVATTDFDWWWGTEQGEDDQKGSSVTVLKENRNGELVTVGAVTGIAPGEQIYATRFLGDKGYLVTFRRVDPLFTLDLSDPRNPLLVGELETTGYSAYLHPVDDDNLLAVGMEADEDGRMIGLSVSLFDVSDFARPRLAYRYLLESSPDAWSWSEALWDHHAFTYHRGVLSIPVYVWEQQQELSGILVLAVDPASGISELGRVDHSEFAGGDRWVQVRRSVYVEDYLYSLSSGGLKVNELFSPQVELAAVPFYPAAP